MSKNWCFFQYKNCLYFCSNFSWILFYFILLIFISFTFLDFLGKSFILIYCLTDFSSSLFVLFILFTTDVWLTCRWRRRTSLCSVNKSTQGSNSFYTEGNILLFLLFYIVVFFIWFWLLFIQLYYLKHILIS